MGERVGGEPGELGNFKAVRATPRFVAADAAKKNNFHLVDVLDSVNKRELYVSQLHPGFFAQLAAQRFVRVLAVSDEAARNAPPAAFAQNMPQEQDPLLLVADNGPGCNAEARLREADGEAPHPERRAAPDFTDQHLPHAAYSLQAIIRARPAGPPRRAR